VQSAYDALEKFDGTVNLQGLMRVGVVKEARKIWRWKDFHTGRTGNALHTILIFKV